MEGNETQPSCAGLTRASRFGAQCVPKRDGRNFRREDGASRLSSGHDEKTNKPAHDGGKTISANPYVLQELAKPEGEREHEIVSRRRRGLIAPHGYPLSGRDGAGRRVLFHSGEKEKSGAQKA